MSSKVTIPKLCVLYRALMQFLLLFCEMETGCEGEAGQCYVIIFTVTSRLSYQGSALYCCRCFFIAQSYVLVKKWSEALVLYERVLKYAREVQAGAGAHKNSLKVGTQSSL